MPRRRTWIFIGIGAIVGAALTPVIVPPILGWFGFGAAGPVASELKSHPSSILQVMIIGRQYCGGNPKRYR